MKKTKINGRKMFDEMAQNMLIRIQKENFGTYELVEHEMKYTGFEKDVGFYFKNNSLGFGFIVYADCHGDYWLERIRIDMFGYEKVNGETEIIVYKESEDGDECVEKLYYLLKDEIKNIIEQYPYFRMKYLFDRDKMIETKNDLQEVLKRRKDEKDETEKI